MKLPIDQRSSGEATPDLLGTLLAASAPPEREPRLRRYVRGLLRWLRLVVDGHDRVDIPDSLREDAGLPPAEEPRRPEPWDRQW